MPTDTNTETEFNYIKLLNRVRTTLLIKAKNQNKTPPDEVRERAPAGMSARDLLGEMQKAIGTLARKEGGEPAQGSGLRAFLTCVIERDKANDKQKLFPAHFIKESFEGADDFLATFEARQNVDAAVLSKVIQGNLSFLDGHHKESLKDYCDAIEYETGEWVELNTNSKVNEAHTGFIKSVGELDKDGIPRQRKPGEKNQGCKCPMSAQEKRADSKLKFRDLYGEDGFEAEAMDIWVKSGMPQNNVMYKIWEFDTRRRDAFANEREINELFDCISEEIKNRKSAKEESTRKKADVDVLRSFLHITKGNELYFKQLNKTDRERAEDESRGEAQQNDTDGVLVLKSLWNYCMAENTQAGSWLAISNQGYALSALGRLETALETFYRAMAINPFNPKSYINAGYANMLLDNNQMAINCQQMALVSAKAREDLFLVNVKSEEDRKNVRFTSESMNKLIDEAYFDKGLENYALAKTYSFSRSLLVEEEHSGSKDAGIALTLFIRAFKDAIRACLRDSDANSDSSCFNNAGKALHSMAKIVGTQKEKMKEVSTNSQIDEFWRKETLDEIKKETKRIRKTDEFLNEKRSDKAIKAMITILTHIIPIGKKDGEGSFLTEKMFTENWAELLEKVVRASDFCFKAAITLKAIENCGVEKEQMRAFPPFLYIFNLNRLHLDVELLELSNNIKVRLIEKEDFLAKIDSAIIHQAGESHKHRKLKGDSKQYIEDTKGALNRMEWKISPGSNFSKMLSAEIDFDGDDPTKRYYLTQLDKRNRHIVLTKLDVLYREMDRRLSIALKGKSDKEIEGIKKKHQEMKNEAISLSTKTDEDFKKLSNNPEPAFEIGELWCIQRQILRLLRVKRTDFLDSQFISRIDDTPENVQGFDLQWKLVQNQNNSKLEKLLLFKNPKFSSPRAVSVTPFSKGVLALFDARFFAHEMEEILFLRTVSQKNGIMKTLWKTHRQLYSFLETGKYPVLYATIDTKKRTSYKISITEGCANSRELRKTAANAELVSSLLYQFEKIFRNMPDKLKEEFANYNILSHLESEVPGFVAIRAKPNGVKTQKIEWFSPESPVGRIPIISRPQTLQDLDAPMRNFSITRERQLETYLNEFTKGFQDKIKNCQKEVCKKGVATANEMEEIPDLQIWANTYWALYVSKFKELFWNPKLVKNDIPVADAGLKIAQYIHRNNQNDGLLTNPHWEIYCRKFKKISDEMLELFKGTIATDLAKQTLIDILYDPPKVPE